jgi:precorrin-6B methylase 2
MSFDTLMAVSQRLGVSVEALAALGAELRLRQEGLEGDPRVRALLHDAVKAVDPRLLDAIDPDRETSVLALIQTIFRQAMDLLESPERIPAWSYQDPIILQSQGQVSRLIVRGIDALAAQRSDLGAMLRRGGAFLDVGTGVGWLAIDTARSWPAMRIVGIEPWEPALALARENLAKSGVAERIELRSQRAEHLDDVATFTLAWLPGPFIAAEIAGPALERVHRALVPNGWLVFGINAPPPGQLEEALAALRSVRSGGYPWTPREVEERLRASDFQAVESFSPGGPILFIVGRRGETQSVPTASN